MTKPDGGDARVQLTQTATDAGSPARNDQNPRWSRDGKRIVFERGTGTNVGDTTKELWAINVDAGGSPGGAPQQFTTNRYYDGHPS